MAIMDSATLLQQFKDYLNRPNTDDAFPPEKIYRLLSQAQRQVYSDITAVFPRMLMGAPHAMETTDGGLTYQSTLDDADGTPIYPFGHAEVYMRSTYDTRELFGSTYGARDGDVVFEGNKLRLPQARPGTFTGTLYLRCVQMPVDISASAQPSLQPPFLRDLIVYRALVLAAKVGAERDEKPWEEMYQTAWSGNGAMGSVGYLGLLSTQYRASNDGALKGIAWWRHWLAQGGGVGALA